MFPQQNFYPQQPMNTQMPQMVQPPQMPIQSGGLVTVRSENEARNYMVSLGTSVTFLDENEPYIYTKTMGFSQFDRPTFKKYKLVEENETPTTQCNKDVVYKDDLAPLLDHIQALQNELLQLRESVEKPKTTSTRTTKGGTK